MISFTRFCAYRFQKERSDAAAAAPSLAISFQPLALTHETIDVFFKNNEQQRLAFHRFCSKGADGWILADGPRFVSYGWVTNCAVFMPPHLGKNLAAPMNWIFYAGTHPDYRGRGAFPALLLYIANTQLASDRELYLDTLTNNSASRRAVEKTGFKPCGLMWSLSVRIPKRQPLVWSGWNLHKAHPPIA
jgi:RimJ/RimL family protein N-acetyltransferase